MNPACCVQILPLRAGLAFFASRIDDDLIDRSVGEEKKKKGLRRYIEQKVGEKWQGVAGPGGRQLNLLNTCKKKDPN